MGHEDLRAQTTALHSRVQVDRAVAAQVAAASAELRRSGRELQARARALREETTALVQRAPLAGPPLVGWPRMAAPAGVVLATRAPDVAAAAVAFELDGFLGGRRVRATYRDGTLRCDERLYSHAALFVELGEVFELGTGEVATPATLSGEGPDVLVTLVRAVDAVVDLRVDLT